MDAIPPSATKPVECIPASTAMPVDEPAFVHVLPIIAAFNGMTTAGAKAVLYGGSNATAMELAVGERTLESYTHVFKMARVCKAFYAAALDAPDFYSIFRGEYLGINNLSGDDPNCEANVVFERTKGHLNPTITMYLKIGRECVQYHPNDGAERLATLNSCEWVFPIELKSAWKHFFKPPGWVQAANFTAKKDTFAEDLVPDNNWEYFFSPNHVPEPMQPLPMGDMQCVIRRKTLRVRGEMNLDRCTWRDATCIDVTNGIPASASHQGYAPPQYERMQLAVSCNTDIKEDTDGVGRKSWFIPDLDVKLTNAVLPAIEEEEADPSARLSIREHSIVRDLMNTMNVPGDGQPELIWRWDADTLRRLVGWQEHDADFIANHLEQEKRKCAIVVDSSDEDAEAPPPSAGRRRRTAAVRAKAAVAANVADDALGEKALEDEDDLLPYSPKKPAVIVENEGSDGDDKVESDKESVGSLVDPSEFILQPRPHACAEASGPPQLVPIIHGQPLFHEFFKQVAATAQEAVAAHNECHAPVGVQREAGEPSKKKHRAATLSESSESSSADPPSASSASPRNLDYNQMTNDIVERSRRAIARAFADSDEDEDLLLRDVNDMLPWGGSRAEGKRPMQ